MNDKEAMTAQREVLKRLTPPEIIEQVPKNVRWKVGVIFVEREGANLRRTLDTHVGDVTPDILLWCMGVEECRDPRDIIPEIICAILAETEHANN